MRIALIGAGNTAASTLLQLLASGEEHDIVLIARDADRALAALLDAASAFPHEAQRVILGIPSDIKKCDVIVVCAGVQMKAGEKPKDVLQQNAAMVLGYLRGQLSDHARVVVIGTPVDDLTAILVHAGLADKTRIIGFGGDLDTARLHYVLGQSGVTDRSAVCIGEHGSRTIPVYASEEKYADVATDVRGLLKRITAKAGAPRNLATGVWLSKLALSLTRTESGLHNVCAFMLEFDICLTWPRMIAARGVLAPQPIIRGKNAELALTALVEQKRKERPDLQVLARA